MKYKLISNPNPLLYTTVEQIFINRGFTLQELKNYFSLSSKNILNPLLLMNMDKGAKLFLQHLNNQHKIGIIVDPDVDGFTSAALLTNYIYSLYPEFVENNIIHIFHPDKHHGIILEDIPLQDIQLLIVPDAGSNDFEQHKILQEKGIDVLILDHHEADHISENACVINNQLCNYPTKSLSGVGIVYKFCSYLDTILNVNKANDFLDLAALGIIADVMSLKDGETRFLIEQGILNIKNKFISTMIEKQQYFLKDKLTPFGIAFYIAPLINATIRVGSLDEKILLFHAFLSQYENTFIVSTKRGVEKGTQELLVDQVCRNCVNIKAAQAKQQTKLVNLINDYIKNNNSNDKSYLLIPIDEGSQVENSGLIGLVANVIAGTFKKPTIILSYNQKLGLYTGSGRNVKHSPLKNFRQFIEDSKLVEFAQGHASAFGVAIQKDNLPLLINYLDLTLQNFDNESSYFVDYIWPYNSLSQRESTIFEICKYSKYWGQGVEQPYIVVENIPINKANILLLSPTKNPTIKITCGNISLMKFKASREEYDQLLEREGQYITVVGTCEKNEWMGRVTPQIIIEDYNLVIKTFMDF